MAGKVHSKRFGHREFVPVNSGNDVCRDMEQWLASISHDDPARVAAILTDLRRPRDTNSHRYGVAVRASIKEPMLNADKGAIERSLHKHFDEHGSKHAKLKIIKKILVKPESGNAAKVAGSWACQSWEVWSLKYSPGLILRGRNGMESDVFPGWGKMRAVLEQIGFKIIR